MNQALLEALGEPWPPADLNDRIVRLRGALDRAPPDATYLSTLHWDLAVALWERLKRDGSYLDSADVFDHLNASMESADERDPAYLREMGGLLLNLGTTILTLGERSHDAEMLGRAIEAFRSAMTFLPPGEYGHAMLLSNLGMALHFRHIVTGDPGDVAEAVDVLRKALRETSSLSPSRPGRLTNLCIALNSSSELTHDSTELDEAIEAGQTALRTVPHTSADRARMLANVAMCFENRFKETGSDKARAEALTYFEAAARCTTSPAWDRIRPARGWGRLAADYGTATTAFGYAVDLLPILAWHGLDTSERLSYLGAVGLTGLASEAAAYAIADRRPDRAIQFLEHGRGVLLGQLLNLRTDLSALAADHPGLAEELTTIRTRLDSPGEPERESRRVLATRWDELLTRIRDLPDSADFLRPPRLEALLPAAAGGPAVVVNLSSLRCDALLVTGDQIRLRELPDLTAAAVTEQANRYLAVLDEAEHARRVSLSARRAATDIGSREASARYRDTVRELDNALRRQEQTLQEIMGWLWDTIAEPVLVTLGFTGPRPVDQPWPRLWWCPTGPLSLLPLHAAGRYEAGDTVLDRVVSSYTPTLRALAEARQDSPDATVLDRMLVVALADTPGQAPLPAVAGEADLLTSLFPGDRHTLLEGSTATRERVSQELPRHRWAHLSCHGDQDLAQPLQGGLLLYDGMISFDDLIARRHHGEYAFLSACKTATGGLSLADEAITIASALHYTGYRHVIATSWTVPDSKASELANSVYAFLTPDGVFSPGRTALALHHAVRSLRDAYSATPSVWMSFTHTGP